MRARAKILTALLAASVLTSCSPPGSDAGTAADRQEYLRAVMAQAQGIYDETGAYPRSIDDVDAGKYSEVSNTWFITNGPASALCVELSTWNTEDWHVYSGSPDVAAEGSCDMDVVHEQGLG